MKKIFLYIAIATCGLVISCNKGYEFKPTVVDAVSIINTHRVKEIAGIDAEQGEYKLIFSYNTNNELDTVWRYSYYGETIDTTYEFIRSWSSEVSIIRNYDRVLAIDADSVEILKNECPSSYQDSLINRSAYQTKRLMYTYYEGTPMSKIESVYNYTPRNVAGLGNDFSYAYNSDYNNKFMYEYNDNYSKILIMRYTHTVYNTEDDELNDEFVRKSYKAEINYNGNNIASVDFYDLEAGSNDDYWNLYKTSTYTYSGSTLMSCDSDNLKINRSGNVLTVTEDNVTNTYTVNDSNYVTKIDFGTGGSWTVTYESGHGDFGELYISTFDKTLGVPYIR